MRKHSLLLATMTLLGSASAFATDMRMDCRFHGSAATGPKFCYGSVEYRSDNARVLDIQNFGVGCDGQTIYNDLARYVAEATLDRVSPQYAATPGIEVFPQYSMGTEGTYSANLDIDEGRFEGTCYVQILPSLDD